VNRRLLAGAALVLAVLLVTATAVAVPAVFAAQRQNNTTSTYYYAAEVSTNATLSDATLYFPLPVDPDGEPTVEEFRVTSYDGPTANWTTWIEETQRGPMLAVEAPEIVGLERYYLVRENGSLAQPGTITREEAPENMTGLRLEPAPTRYEIRAQVAVESFGNGIENGTIETRHPRGNSSTLSTVGGYDVDGCDPIWNDTGETCATFQSDLYVAYDADPSTEVRVGPVELWGVNEWGWFFANSFNEYTQRVEQVEFTGSHEGWLRVAGELHAGRGTYGVID